MWSRNYRFQTFFVGDLQMPAVMLGTSPFIGAGQFGDKAEFYYNHFFLQPENVTDVVVAAVGLGVNAVQVIAYRPVLEAVRDAARRTHTDLFLMGTVGVGSIDKEIKMMLDADAQALILHGSLADRDLTFVADYMAPLREQGLVTGIATHRPGMTIPRVEARDDVDIILCPLNKTGRFMKPSAESSLRAIEATSKRVIAMKPLAAGDLAPDEGLPYLAGKVVGLAVGIVSCKEAEETFAVAERYFPSTVTSPPVTPQDHPEQGAAPIEGL